MWLLSKYSGTFIFTLLALVRVQKDFLEVRHVLDNSGGFSDMTSNSLKLWKYKSL